MRRIALVGTTSTGKDAPYADQRYEIWGVSARAEYVTRADRWFELHRLDGEPQPWADNWRGSIRRFIGDTELLMLYPEPDLGTNVTRYPAERITARFGTYFMTSSFSWMMALAIDEMCPLGGEWNPGEIAIFGVEMEQGTEYRQQRAGFRHFIDLARVLGINVVLLASGGLAYEPVPYPLWQDDALLNKVTLRQEETIAKMKMLDESIRNTRTMIAQNRAVIGALSEYGGPPEVIARLEKELAALLETSSHISKDIVATTAVDAEQQWLSDYLQH